MLYGYGLVDNEYDGFTVHMEMGEGKEKAVILRKDKT